MAPPIVVRTYRAPSQAKAAVTFQADANTAGQQGYVPISQSWASSRSGSAAAAMVVAAIFFILGILFLIPLVVVAILLLIAAVATPGQGELTVTYQRT